jgi:hypothetical protein
MYLMLATMFACLLVGLFAPKIGHRAQAIVAILAAAMTTLYLLFPYRFT